MVGRRLTVAQAAEVLGVSANAVRMRVRRGSLASEKDAEGRVWILVGPDEQASVTDQHAPDQPTRSELTEELRDRIAYLERQVEDEREARREESRELRRLLAGLIERVPELEAPAETPPETQDATRTGSEGPGRADTPQQDTRPGEGDSGPLWHSADAAPEEPPIRPWWRRWFGG